MRHLGKLYKEGIFWATKDSQEARDLLKMKCDTSCGESESQTTGHGPRKVSMRKEQGEAQMRKCGPHTDGECLPATQKKISDLNHHLCSLLSRESGSS